MSKAVAAITLALASTFAAGAAEAHDHRNHYHHRGPEHRYNAPPPRYYAPPPVRYYAPPPPPVYVEPVAPTVYCSPRFNRYGEEVGSIRQNQNPYTGQLSRPYASREFCY